MLFIPKSRNTSRHTVKNLSSTKESRLFRKGANILTYRIYNLLPTGEQNAIHAEELAGVAGVTPRELRKEIERERREGALILSSPNGYFRHEEGNTPELRRFIQTMERRGKSTFSVIKVTREALRAEETAESQYTLEGK